jgi:hypothetical protein
VCVCGGGGSGEVSGRKKPTTKVSKQAESDMDTPLHQGQQQKQQMMGGCLPFLMPKSQVGRVPIWGEGGWRECVEKQQVET